MRFCLNLKPTTNDVYWRDFWIFLYFFVYLLRALPTFLFGKLILSSSYKKFSKINTSLFSDRISLRRLAKLYKNPRARLNLPVRINKICPFWARTTTVFVFRGYLSRVKIVFRDSSFYRKWSLFCLLWLSSGRADRTGYITNFCSMIKLLQELKNSSF